MTGSLSRREALTLAALAVAGCKRSGPARTDTLLVHAAASLTDVLPRVASAWESSGGMHVRFDFDATSRLARAIESGAPGDAVFCADAVWMDDLEHHGSILRDTRIDLLGNSLVLAVPSAATTVPTTPAELASPSLRRLALAGESVPAGRYARAALRAAGVWSAVESRVVEGDSVRATLSWVARGEADAAVVYATDVRVEARVREAFRFPEDSYPRIVYPAAVLASSEHAARAREFVAYGKSPAARALWQAAGFTVSS